MSELTTEMLREDFVNLLMDTNYRVTEDMANAMFDRWLEQHDAEVTKATEEHIIKLLEKEYNDTIEFFGIALAKRELDLLIKLIALIKGENKTNPWTSRPLTEEDIEHYGLEGEDK